MYSKSTDVVVFPTTKRQVKDKVYSEYTTTRLVYDLIDPHGDEDGFIISYNNSNPTNIELAFNIKGYYFNITHFNNILNGMVGDAIYANIVIDLTTSEDYPELSGTDTERDLDTGEPSESSVYAGLSFDSTRGIGDGRYSLLLFNKVNNAWVLNEDSKIKFNTESIRNIDGGEI